MGILVNTYGRDYHINRELPAGQASTYIQDVTLVLVRCSMHSFTDVSAVLGEGRAGAHFIASRG
jgi:hypothetical protein